jgi:peptidoglycan hydrolase CwlO-like protein
LLAAAIRISDLEQQVETLKKSDQEKDAEIDHLKKYVETIFIEKKALEAKVNELTQVAGDQMEHQ